MVSQRKRVALLACTGLVSAAACIPSVRHAIERSPQRWFLHHAATTNQLATGPRWLAPEAPNRPKISTRAAPIETMGTEAAADEAPLTVADASAAAAQTGPALPGPGEAPIPPATATEIGAPAGPSIADKDNDEPLVRQAIDFYRHDDLASGDRVAKSIVGPLARLTTEWSAIRLDAHQAGLARLDAFVAAHPDWPALSWINRRIEEAIAADRTNVGQADARLGPMQLKTVAGKVALAEARRSQGQSDAAASIIHQVWRDDELTPWQESFLSQDFGTVIDREDHRIRAEHFLYHDKIQAGLKEAALAGPDMLTLAKARAAVVGNSAQAELFMAAVAKNLQPDPLLLFSKVQRLRRLNRNVEAADLLLTAPHGAAELVDGDEWWTERRIVARKLLDLGDARKAYRICADHGDIGASSAIEAEFHAGWIALRFLDDAKTAANHFATMAGIAETPISKSRAAYWQGRAAEIEGSAEDAMRHYTEAARFDITFYGQLAAARLGQTSLSLRTTSPAIGSARSEAVRTTEYLYGVGARDIALPLAVDIARSEPAEAQVGALGEVLERNRDAWATLTVGKTATQRGMALDDTAFPTFGIPNFRPLPNSADLSVVYAIARQESEFDQRSNSTAGAKGLMQMISSTARSTAVRAGIAYDDGRLASDPAFNAQLGAAHLGTLLDEEGGSYILAFAAYNAGGRAVKDWIAAYGDPRKPGIDVVDWIERIPYSETRNYVQRVMENLQIYRAKLGRPSVLVMGVETQPAGKGT